MGIVWFGFVRMVGRKIERCLGEQCVQRAIMRPSLHFKREFYLCLAIINVRPKISSGCYSKISRAYLT